MRLGILALLGVFAVGCTEPAAEHAVVVTPTEAPPPPPEPEPPSPPPPRLVLEASGDLVLNGLAMAAVRRGGDEAAGYRALLAGYGEVLEADALTYLNLEMPLVDHYEALDGGWPRSRTERPRRAPTLGATPALATVLAELGVDFAPVANNHALDQGYRGLADTLRALDAAGIRHAGVGADGELPSILERGGFRIALFAATEWVNRRADDGPVVEIARTRPSDPLLAAIAAVRSEVDVVVVAAHWSSDFFTEVTDAQRNLATELVAHGADIVLGTGPHVLQPVEVIESARGQALVAYSLGNLASGMGRAYRFGVRPSSFIHPANVIPEARDGVVLRVVITRRGGRLELDARATLLFTENDFLEHPDAASIRVRPLARVASAACRDRFPAMRAALGPNLELVPADCPPN